MFDKLSDLPPEVGENIHRAMVENFHVTPADGNVFADLELPHAADLLLIAEAGSDREFFPSLPLNEMERETLRRMAAARRDSAMLGDSGYERIEADAYFTPPENVDCLLEHVDLHPIVWEPACGDGAIVNRLIEFGHTVVYNDLYDYGLGTGGDDFLLTTEAPPGVRSIVSNPPYGDMVEKFIRHALELMRDRRGQVAFFLRNEYDCSKGRMDLFSLPPFAKKIIVTKRPRWVVGSTGSPRHNYAWFVWDFRLKAGSGTISYSHPDFAPGPVQQ